MTEHKIPDVVGAFPTLRIVGLSEHDGGRTRLLSTVHGDEVLRERHRATCVKQGRHLTFGQIDLLVDEILRRHEAGDERATELVNYALNRTGKQRPAMAAAAELTMLEAVRDPVPHEDDVTPALWCSCGFYGWYPWTAEPSVNDEPKPWSESWCPLLHDLAGAVNTLCYLRATGSPSCGSRLIVVQEVSGKIVPHTRGVRAEYAEITAIVDPTEAFDLHFPSDRQAWWGPVDYVSDCPPHYVDDAGVELIEAAHRTGRRFSLPVISFTEAVARGREWDACKHLIPGLGTARPVT